MKNEEIEKKQKAYFLKLFRNARYKTQEDAEDFSCICFALEEFAVFAFRVKKSGLGKYKDDYRKFFKNNFFNGERLYALLCVVHKSRNDYAHQGVFARNSARKAQSLAIELESKLMKDLSRLEHIMSEDIAYANPELTVSKIREIMLLNSFSYLPLRYDDSTYYMISDIDIARLWNKRWDDNRSENEKIRNEKLYITHFREIFDEHLPKGSKIKADILDGDIEIEEVADKLSHIPILVKGKSGAIVGIVTAFDWL